MDDEHYKCCITLHAAKIMDNMEHLDLKRVLKKLGAARLSGLIGETRLESICSIMKEKVTENELVQILLLRYVQARAKEYRAVLLYG